jgi:hypothetical protein
MEIFDDQQVSSRQLLFSAEVRRRFMRRRRYQPSSLRREYNVNINVKDSEPQQVEYTVILSGTGLNILDEGKVGKSVSIPSTEVPKIEANKYLQLQMRFPQKTRAQWWFDLPFHEQKSIKIMYHLSGPCIKIQFANAVEREKALKSANVHYLGGKEIRVHTHTPMKPAPVACPRTPECKLPSSSMAQGKDVDAFSSEQRHIYFKLR